jgi:hypothetical protein
VRGAFIVSVPTTESTLRTGVSPSHGLPNPNKYHCMISNSPQIAPSILVSHTHTHATKDKHCTHMHFKSSYPFPFECIAYPKIPGPTSLPLSLSLFPLALKTMAPAPSPNRIHEFRSSQSTHRVRASAPMTSACLAAPLLLLLLLECLCVGGFCIGYKSVLDWGGHQSSSRERKLGFEYTFINERIRHQSTDKLFRSLPTH